MQQNSSSLPTSQLPCQFIIEADHIVTQATVAELFPEQSEDLANNSLEDAASRVILQNAALAIKDGKIIAVGAKEELLQHFAPAEQISLGNSIIMPGLVNAHTHSAMTIFRGLSDDLPLMQWLTEYIFPNETRLTAEIVEAGTMLGCAEMIRSGTTAACDMYLMEQTVCKAVDASGMKMLGGEALYTFPSPAYKNEDEAFQLLEQQVADWRGHPRIRFSVSPHSVYTTTAKLLERCGDFAQKHSLPLQIHLSETKTETAECLKLHGQRPVAFCDSLGLLGSSTSIAHAVDLEPDEIELLAERGVKVVHNPKSNMKLASGIAPIPQMLQCGIDVGLGTDGPASNNTLNMFSEMNVAALLHKVDRHDPTALPAQQVLDMATRGSAAALHWQGIGRLAPGYAADLIALDLDAANLQPLHNPVSQLVYAASGHEVTFSMVNGTILYQNDRYTHIDIDILRKEIKKISDFMKKH